MENMALNSTLAGNIQESVLTIPGDQNGLPWTPVRVRGFSPPSIGQSSSSGTGRWNLVSTSVELGSFRKPPSSTDYLSGHCSKITSIA